MYVAQGGSIGLFDYLERGRKKPIGIDFDTKLHTKNDEDARMLLDNKVKAPDNQLAVALDDYKRRVITEAPLQEQVSVELPGRTSFLAELYVQYPEGKLPADLADNQAEFTAYKAKRDAGEEPTVELKSEEAMYNYLKGLRDELAAMNADEYAEFAASAAAEYEIDMLEAQNVERPTRTVTFTRGERNKLAKAGFDSYSRDEDLTDEDVTDIKEMLAKGKKPTWVK